MFQFIKKITLVVLLLSATNLLAQIPTLGGYNHVCLQVRNIETSVKYYKEIIGLEQMVRPQLVRPGAWFKVGPGQEMHIHGGRTEEIKDNGEGAAHISFTILDADKVEAYLKTKNVVYHRQKRVDGAYQIYVTDPDGYVVELNEPRR